MAVGTRGSGFPPPDLQIDLIENRLALGRPSSDVFIECVGRVPGLVPGVALERRETLADQFVVLLENADGRLVAELPAVITAAEYALHVGTHVFHPLHHHFMAPDHEQQVVISQESLQTGQSELDHVACMEQVTLLVVLVLQLVVAHRVTPQQVQHDLLVVVHRLVAHLYRFW